MCWKDVPDHSHRSVHAKLFRDIVQANKGPTVRRGIAASRYGTGKFHVDADLFLGHTFEQELNDLMRFRDIQHTAGASLRCLEEKGTAMRQRRAINGVQILTWRSGALQMGP